MKKLFVTIAVILAFSAAKAQGHLGINLQAVIPTNEYKQATDDVGIGFGFNFWIPLGYDIPVFVGLDFGYDLLGKDTRRLSQTAEVVFNGTVVDRIPLNYRTVTNNSALHTHVGVRVKAPLEIVQPYAEGLVGFNYLYTRFKMFDESPNRGTQDKDNQITSQNLSSDFVFSYGGGGGLFIMLSDNVALDLKCVYLLGKEAEYFKKKDIKNFKVQFTTNNPTNTGSTDLTPEVTTVKTRSKTDMFYATLGLSIVFQ